MRWGWIAAAALQGVVGWGVLSGDFEKPFGRIGGAILLLSAAICLFSAFSRTPTGAPRGWQLNGKWLFAIAAIAGYGLAITFQMPHPKGEQPHALADTNPSPSATLPEPPIAIALAKKAQADAIAAEKNRAAEEKRVVGRWLHPVLGIILIKKYTTGYALIIEPSNGDPSWIKVRQHPSARGLRLDLVDTPTHDQYIILPSGQLDLRDNDGEVMTLEPATGATIEARAAQLDNMRSNLECNADIDCVVKANVAVDEPACRQAIERSAKWNVSWNNSFGSIFSGYRFNPKHHVKDGIIDYYGDGVRFQNGFGAWTNMTYVCTVDTKSNQILKIKLTPGYLR